MVLYSCSYQPPIPADQVRPAAEFDQDAEAISSGRGRGRGRRGRGRGRGFSDGAVDYNDEFGEPEEAPHGNRGRGRGRGRRGSFGPGRGYGGDAYPMEEAGEYDDGYNAPPMQGYEGGRGRGRGWGRGRGRGRGGRGRGPPPQE